MQVKNSFFFVLPLGLISYKFVHDKFFSHKARNLEIVNYVLHYEITIIY
jgi:hypothetical protein